MKIEVRCPSCGRGYLVEESRIPPDGAQVACKACGRPIDLPAARPAPPAPPRSDSPPPTARPGPAAAPPGEAVCPRCGLHFDAGGGPAASLGGGRACVLVVEDLDYFLEIARDALSPKYDLLVARNLREAREALASSKVDVILLDVTLENGEDGLSLLRDLRPKPCPVVIYTAEDETEMYGESWKRLRALGADDLVLKGINAGDSLAGKIAALLGETDTEPLSR